MLERHVTFNVLPGKESDFEKLFQEEYGPAMSAQAGFVSVSLLQEKENPSRYQMTIRFQDEETAAGWRKSPEHEGLKPKIKALYQGSELIVFDVSTGF